MYIQAGAELQSVTNEDAEDTAPISSEISEMSKLFPFIAGGAWHSDESLDALLALLPPQPRAWTLCETYLEQASWSFRPIKRDEYIDEILTPIYKYLRDKQNPECQPTKISPHKLAVLFMVFALGALVDLTLPAFNVEAENYFQSGRAALALRSVLDSPEIASVQAVVLMAAYHNLAGNGYAMDRGWCLISLGAKLAQSVRL